MQGVQDWDRSERRNIELEANAIPLEAGFVGNIDILEAIPPVDFR